jgi:Tol biopolymer transport system component
MLDAAFGVLLAAAVTGAPALHLPETIRTEEHESLAAAAPDGGELFLTRSRADFGAARVHVLRRRGDGWLPPQPLSFSDGSHRDSGGCVSADGRLLYFTSSRPTGLAQAPDDWNLFVVAREEDGWGTPRALPEPLNSARSECCAVAAADGSLYFSSERDGSWDIFRARATGQDWHVEKLPEGVNGGGMEWPSYVSPDGGLLLFSSIRRGGLGADDLYVASAKDGRFGAPSNLGPRVNTAGFEDSASLSPDGRLLIYSSRTPEGTSDVYAVPWRP